MRLTPLDIQQMSFKIRWRGYDQDEVKLFLEDMAQTVEALNQDNAGLRERLAEAEQQLAALKKAEATLTHTLLSTQAMADDMRQVAQRDAALLVKEAELKAAELLREGRQELANLHRDISELRKQRLVAIERLRSTVRTFERVLEIEEEEIGSDSPLAEQAKLSDTADR